MLTEDPQKVWEDFFGRKKSQCLQEAADLWRQMKAAGVVADTVLALDFVHFGQCQHDVEALANQLSENYEMEVVESERDGYWLVRGTTRPYGIEMTEEQHRGWVEFMADVAESYACVFSTWTIEAPALGTNFHSEGIESAS
ncbi:hypothetical protein [Marinobacter sp. CHS3-4]|uniref:hypothetical protein n=1 Tax=Marinobacter sp. CHS3-4 TaxID=3045174 RepID=UPI0024B534FC|nr:hypothetical protein [Marinobacter sp. CHS3-4]MDI9246440.1 hypothetical protein [Marinobacter sp. CHS3-4]